MKKTTGVFSAHEDTRTVRRPLDIDQIAEEAEQLLADNNQLRADNTRLRNALYEAMASLDAIAGQHRRAVDRALTSLENQLLLDGKEPA